MANAAIILAAGRGSRMKGLTDAKPKCLTPIAGKPLLAWQLAALRGAGVENVLVVRGYKAECIAGDFETAHNPRWESTNMLASLLCAESFARRFFDSGGEKLIISYSDIVYPSAHVQSLLKTARPVAIAYDTLWEDLWRLRFADPLADAETFSAKDGLLVEIGGKTDNMERIDGQYMGLLAFTAQGWQQLLETCRQLGGETARTDMTAFLRKFMARGHAIGAVPVAGRWCEVDSGEDLQKYEAALQTGQWRHDWREKENHETR